MSECAFNAFNLISGQVDLWTRKSVGCACSWKNDNNYNEHEHASNKHETSDKNVTLHNGQMQQHHHQHGHQLNCACCVKGGCQCGEQFPNRCSQCGLETHCSKSTFTDSTERANFCYHVERVVEGSFLKNFYVIKKY